MGCPSTLAWRATVSRREPAVLDDGRLAAHAAANQRTGPGLQLLEREGLGQVVVGAQVEPLDPVAQRVARREDQHRHPRLAPPHAAQHLQPVQLGEARGRG